MKTISDQENSLHFETVKTTQWKFCEFFISCYSVNFGEERNFFCGLKLVKKVILWLEKSFTYSHPPLRYVFKFGISTANSATKDSQQSSARYTSIFKLPTNFIQRSSTVSLTRSLIWKKNGLRNFSLDILLRFYWNPC